MLPIHYGACYHDSYIDAGEMIVHDFEQGSMENIVDKVNNTFFGGGVFAAKSFSSLGSIEFPDPPSEMYKDQDSLGWHIKIGTLYSFNAMLGYVEGIPGIGSLLAIIKAVGHLLAMLASYLELRHAVKQIKTIERSDYNMNRGECCDHTDKVFHAAVDYVVHRNLLLGSLLSLVPLVKPIVRITQGLSYQRSIQ